MTEFLLENSWFIDMLILVTLKGQIDLMWAIRRYKVPGENRSSRNDRLSHCFLTLSIGFYVSLEFFIMEHFAFSHLFFNNISVFSAPLLARLLF